MFPNNFQPDNIILRFLLIRRRRTEVNVNWIVRNVHIMNLINKMGAKIKHWKLRRKHSEDHLGRWRLQCNSYQGNTKTCRDIQMNIFRLRNSCFDKSPGVGIHMKRLTWVPLIWGWKLYNWRFIETVAFVEFSQRPSRWNLWALRSLGGGHI